MAKKADKKFATQRQHNRTFSPEFKKAKIKDLVTGQITIKGLTELYGVSRTSVYNWLYLYSEGKKGVKTVVQMESEAEKTKLLLSRLAEYERIIGQKQLQIDVLEKVVEMTSQELGFDVKKKYGAALWSGSVVTLPLTPTP